MKTILVILAIYWVAVIVSTYIIRHFNGKKPLNQFLSSFPNQKKESKWMHPFIVFLLPIVLPFLLLGVGIGTLVEKLRGKSSKPEKEQDLDFLSDLLKDEPEKDAVCTLDLQEDLPDSDHKTAALALGTALITKEFSEFKKLLDEEVSLVLYDDRTIRGKDAVVSYWRSFLAKENNRNKDVEMLVGFCVRFHRAALILKLYLQEPIVVFRMVDGKVVNMVLAPLYYYENGNAIVTMEGLPYTVDAIGRNTIQIVEARPNLLPCLYCGRPSEQLKWQRVRFEENDVGYEGLASVCPCCHKMVEYVVQKPFGPSESYGRYKWDLPQEADEDTYYAQKGKQFHKWLQANLETFDEADGKTMVLGILDKLHLASGAEMGFHFATEELASQRDYSYFYVSSATGEKKGLPYSFEQQIMVEPSVEGVWQLFLLMSSYHVMPFWGDGIYNYQNYIFQMSDLQAIGPTKNLDYSDLKREHLLLPSVTIKELKGDVPQSGTDAKWLAVIECSKWNIMKGLVREKDIVILDGAHKLLSYKKEKDEVLSAYYAKYRMSGTVKTRRLLEKRWLK
jgi:hypothetical protein